MIFNLLRRPMSFHTAASKLSPPVKDLVISFTKNGTLYIGVTEEDKKEVNDWIEKSSIITDPKFQVCRTLKYHI